MTLTLTVTLNGFSLEFKTLLQTNLSSLIVSILQKVIHFTTMEWKYFAFLNKKICKMKLNGTEEVRIYPTLRIIWKRTPNMATKTFTLLLSLISSNTMMIEFTLLTQCPTLIVIFSKTWKVMKWWIKTTFIETHYVELLRETNVSI